MPMIARYIGDEDMPNSKSTVLYGARRQIGKEFEVPKECESSARGNPYVEVVREGDDAQAKAGAQQASRPQLHHPSKNKGE